MNAEIYQSKITLRGSPLDKKQNPQPCFRSQKHDLPVKGNGFAGEQLVNFGAETAFRILPYTRQDRYGRELVQMELPSIVLENEFLKAEFIPSLGGRLWSLYDKKEKREILYRNPLFRPANLAIRDAWFSGGVEWNIGRFGHSVHTCSPVFAGAGRYAEGGGDGTTPVLRIWEFERQTRLYWRIDFCLYKNILLAYIRIENHDGEEKLLYWWTNTAVPQNKGVRVIAATDRVIYMEPGETVKTMSAGRLPNLPVLPGLDASFPEASYYSNEYFFQKPSSADSAKPAFPFEAAVQADGYAFAEASTPPLYYRKMFCWGGGRGGGRWQEYLSQPGESYLEVQAGLAPTQLHSSAIGANSTVDWVQAFTGITDTGAALGCPYNEASRIMEEKIAAIISPSLLSEKLTLARTDNLQELKLLSLGSGWGYVEERRALRQGRRVKTEGFIFPKESAGEEEKPWLHLAERGEFPRASVEAGPVSFAADKYWEELLLKAHEHSAGQGSWFTACHLGVIAMEKGDAAGARAYWEESDGAQDNPWALRNLAQLFLSEGKKEQALDYSRRAYLHPAACDRSFAEEYLALLLECGRVKEAAEELDRYESRKAGASYGFLLETKARIAAASGDKAALEKAFTTEPEHIREGSNVLTDLWTARHPGEEPPRQIDFRMFIKRP
jgi:tetratricopeptide (TPR) repeat protein